MQKERKVKNVRSHIIKSTLFVACVIVLGAPVLLSGQQATEELPEALGTYLSAMEGMVKCKDISLRHIMPTEEVTFYGYKWGELHTALRNAGDWSVPNVSGQDLSIVVYFSLGARDPEKVKLYRLRTKKDVKPFITMLEEVRLSAVPITDLPGLAGNMVRLVPDHILQKGNYIFMEGDIDSKLLFSIEPKTSIIKRALIGANPKIKDYIETLNKKEFPLLRSGLREEFENNEITFSSTVIVTVIRKGSRWRITDREANTSYLVEKKRKRLDVYDSNEKRSWGFTVDGGGELWRNPAFWAKCMACLCSNGTESVQ